MATGGSNELKVFIDGDSRDAQKDIDALADKVDELGDSAKKSSKEVDKLEENVGELGASLKKTGKSADTASKEMGGLKGGLEDLTEEFERVKQASEKSLQVNGDRVSRELLTVRSSILKLNTEFNETGNTGLFKELRKLRTYERNLQKMAEDVANVGKASGKGGDSKKATETLQAVVSASSKAGLDAGQRFMEMFGVAVGATGPIVQAAIVGVVAGAAVAAAPFVGSILGAAVIGGAGAGGIIGGVMLAARDPRIKTAATTTGEVLIDVLERSAQSFIPAVEKTLGKAQNLFKRLEPALKSAFELSSDLLDPVVDGLIRGVESMMPGLQQALASAKPIFDVLGEGVAGIGEAIGKAFSYISQNSFSIAHALEGFLTVVQGAILATGVFIAYMAELYKYGVAVGKVMSGDVAGGLAFMAQAEQEAAASSQRLLSAQSGLSGGLSSTASAAERQNKAIADLNQKLYAGANKSLGLRDASRGLQAAIDDAAQSLKDNGKTLDTSTAKGRANQAALDGIASAANGMTQQIMDAGGSQEYVSKTAMNARASFVKQATAMGMSKAEAEKLAAKLIAIPSVKRDVKVNAGPAHSGARAAQQAINAVRGKTVEINVSVIGAAAARAAIAGINAAKNASASSSMAQKNAKGGFIRGPGTGTSDSILSWLSNGEYVIPADIVDKYGVDYFERLRNGAIPAYAKGGPVKKPSYKSGKSRNAQGGGFTASFAGYLGAGSALAALRGDANSIVSASKTLLAGFANNVDPYIKKSTAYLYKLAKQREWVAARLQDAKQRLADAIAKRDDFRAQVKASVIQSGNITTGNEEITNSSLILDNLSKQVEKTKKFRALLDKLKKLGVNNTSYQQIVEAGVDGGFATAEALVNGGSGAVAQLNSLQGQLNNAAEGVAWDSSQKLYQAGVDSAKGLIRGLESQAAALKAASDKLANQIINSLKKALGIRSPSKVADEEVGQMVGAGAVRGVERMGPKVGESWRSALSTSGVADAVLSGPASLSSGSTGVVVNVTVQGNVATERDLAKSIATAVRDEIVRKGKNNGGRTGL